MALGLAVAGDIINDALIYYVRGKALVQTMEDRPLLKMLNGAKKPFGGGNLQISIPVQGTFMSDTAGFYAGYSNDDTLTFNQAQNVLRVVYPWKEVHAGLIISHTELKIDGISIGDHQKQSEHTETELTRLTGILENRLADYAESWARMTNFMFWRDGSQDAKQVPGILSIITDTPALGITGGLNRATYPWWQHRAMVNGDKITASAVNQTLSRTLRKELRQLRRYQGKPNVALAGSVFLDALELEVQEKGLYTQEGFKNNGNTDLGMADISMRGLGTFQYDPTLDDLGYAARCYIFDSKHITLKPMEGEENKVLTPERPYQYLVFLRSMTWTGGLVADQLNCHGVYEVAVPV